MKEEEFSAAVASWCCWIADALWKPPTPDMLATSQVLAPLEVDGGSREACDLVKRLSQKVDARSVKAMAVDYTALFCGFDINSSFPYESVYRSEGRLMMQEASAQVKREYERAGFDWREWGATEPPDHFSTELRFVAFLLGKTASGEDSPVEKAPYRQLLEEFVSRHVAAWGAPFCSDFETRAETEFFRAVGMLARAVLLHLPGAAR